MLRERRGTATGMSPAVERARPWRRPAVLAWALWALGALGMLAVGWMYGLIAEAGRADLGGNGGLAPSLAVVSATTVGAVLASRRPAHPVGWLLLGFGVTLDASGLTEAYADYGAVARPGAVPAASYVALYSPAFALAALALLGFVLLLTPTGSLPSPRWRWW